MQGQPIVGSLMLDIIARELMAQKKPTLVASDGQLVEKKHSNKRS